MFDSQHVVMDNIVEQRRGPFVVDLRSRYDEDDRKSVTIPLAWGPKDARNLAEDLNPGYVAVRVEEKS